MIDGIDAMCNKDRYMLYFPHKDPAELVLTRSFEQGFASTLTGLKAFKYAFISCGKKADGRPHMAGPCEHFLFNYHFLIPYSPCLPRIKSHKAPCACTYEHVSSMLLCGYESSNF